MSNPATEALSVVVEREIPFPPEKVWRALTQPFIAKLEQVLARIA
jgi:uncharacterized protein YndB with AHSA1/START domain